MNLPSVRKIFFVLALILLISSASESATTLHYPEEHDIGQPFVAFVSSDVAFDSASVSWMQKETPLEVIKYDDGYRAYALLGADANKTGDGIYPIEFRVSNKISKIEIGVFRIKLKMPRYRENRLTVPRKMVHPPKSEMERIEEEAELVGVARATMTPKKMWEMKVAPPLDKLLYITSSYGYRRVYNGVPRGRHSGSDFRAPVGTPVRSIFSGLVLLTGDHYFAGKSIYVDSGNGVISAYFHLNSIGVKAGDFVAAGDLMGETGKTGRVTGPHLHLSVFLSGQSVDPMGLLEMKFQDMVNKLSVAEL